MSSYDPSNIFAKILRGEIPCKKIFENEHALSFNDITPQAPTHILVIPKGPYASYDDFVGSASDEEIAGFHRAVVASINSADIIATGYRLISNAGVNAHQEVPHYHIHIVGGRDLGAMLA
jgi:histidine triad (HIT) family protein